MSKISPSLKEILTETQCQELLFGNNLDELIKVNKTLENNTKFFGSVTKPVQGKKLQRPVPLEISSNRGPRENNLQEITEPQPVLPTAEKQPTEQPKQACNSNNIKSCESLSGTLLLFIVEWKQITND